MTTQVARAAPVLDTTDPRVWLAFFLVATIGLGVLIIRRLVTLSAPGMTGVRRIFYAVFLVLLCGLAISAAAVWQLYHHIGEVLRP